MTSVSLGVTGGAIGAAVVLLALAWARSRLIMVTVTGRSMMPAYRDGQRLVVVRRARYAVGDVIMFRTPVKHSDPPWLVKRVAAIAGERVPDDLRVRVGEDIVPAGRLLVRSDAAGLDSRHFGLLDARDVMGVVKLPSGPSCPTYPSASAGTRSA